MTEAGHVSDEHFVFRLYITAAAPRSARAVVNTRVFCERYLAGRYTLEILSIADNVAQAMSDQVIAAPTLVKAWPVPARRFIGDMSDARPLLEGLGIDGTAAQA